MPRHTSFVLSIPLLGRISAGMTLNSSELREGKVFFDSATLKGENTEKLFALRVNGESMKDAGILDGDVVIVRQTSQPSSGDIVVALVGDESTVKSFYAEDEKIELRPANPSFQPQFYTPGDVSIQGKVIALQRKLC